MGEVVGAEKVAPPDLRGVQPQFARGDVQQPLHGEHREHLSNPPVAPCWRLVGRVAGGVDLGDFVAIGAEDIDHRGEGVQACPEGENGVRAGIAFRSRTHGSQVAVAVEGGAQRQRAFVRVHAGEEIFAPILDPLQRAASFARQPG